MYFELSETDREALVAALGAGTKLYFSDKRPIAQSMYWRMLDVADRLGVRFTCHECGATGLRPAEARNHFQPQIESDFQPIQNPQPEPELVQ